MRQPPGIYVEILIRGHIEDVWRHTQRPELHEPWDLRFTKIQYLPRASEAESQRFNYSTRIGLGYKFPVKVRVQEIARRRRADGRPR